MAKLTPKLISKKKPNYPVQKPLEDYLIKYNRYLEIPISYEDLMRYTTSIPLVDDDGKDTLWISVAYNQFEQDEIHKGLTEIYRKLILDSNDEAPLHTLRVDSIHYCTFGNSHPFRIKIRNIYNDNYDYFYVKKADASRIYGLELEHILSPNRIFYFVFKDTLIEEHIMGIPGDQFLERHENLKKIEYVRIAKEFVKFNERCFIRLLGDMRAYNFVMVETHDFDQNQYRIRAIDFDQQSYEGRLNIYRPQFYKENLPFVELVSRILAPENIMQYQSEERAMIAKRIKASGNRLSVLLDIMSKDKVSSDEKVKQLSIELDEFVGSKTFEGSKSMGEIVKKGLSYLLKYYS